MNPEAQRYLIARLETLRDQRRDYGAGHEHVRATLAHVGGALEAFRLSDALTEAEFMDWGRRVGEAAGLILPPADAPRGLYAAHFAEDPPKPGAPPAPPPASRFPQVDWSSYTRFNRVVAGPDNELEIAGGSFRVLSLELYENRMRFHWRIAPRYDVDALYAEDARTHTRDTEGLPHAEREQLLQRWRGHQQGRMWHELSVTDDVGTAYEHIGGGSSGHDNEILGSQLVAPAPPDSASVVTIHLRGERFDFRLAAS